MDRKESAGGIKVVAALLPAAAIALSTWSGWLPATTALSPGIHIFWLLFYLESPGLLSAVILSNPRHGFHLWIAAIVNFAFYFLLCWILGQLISGILRGRRQSL
ncbi:MAG TPA: hypothetical protein VKR52_19340 [Terracidiphilus sp.]|nr:hypothetical protein [Terracidiphilus sp.]